MMKIEKLIEPKSIAVIGASRNPDSVGHGILMNLTRGGAFQSEYCRAFDGKIFPVNPHADRILGLDCYPNLKSIPHDVDLAIIAVPSKIVVDVMKDCVTKKVKSIIIISAGFSEVGKAGEKLENKIKEISKKSKIPVLGPNCLGLIRPSNRMNASFAPSMPPEGNVAFITQSGALADSIVDWAIEKRYGFSLVASMGNQAVLDIPDMIEFLEKDEKTKSIAIYMESLSEGRKFIEAAKKVSGRKPIIILKSARTDIGAEAALSHTGKLASSYEIYKAAFKQGRCFVVDTVEDLFDSAKALSYMPACKENNIAIVTNGGGAGVLCADYLSERGVNVAELNKSTINKLDKYMPSSYSKRNPVDIIGDALPDRYDAAINILLKEKNIGGLIVIQTMQTMTKPEENAKILVKAKKEFPNKPIIAVFMGGRLVSRADYILEKNKIPNFNDVSRAAKAMKYLVERNIQKSK